MGAGQDLSRDVLGPRLRQVARAAGVDRGAVRSWSPDPHPRRCGWWEGVLGRQVPRIEAVAASTALYPLSSRVCYASARGKLDTFTPRDAPSPLGAKLAVLRLLARYMQQRPREVRARRGGAGPGCWGHGQPEARKAGSVRRRRAGPRPPPRRPPATVCCASSCRTGLCCCFSVTGHCR